MRRAGSYEVVEIAGGAMNVRLMIQMVVLSLASASALAGQIGPGTVPEPGVIELLSIGAIAAAAVAIRRRRK
jgi:hypothetical protein